MNKKNNWYLVDGKNGDLFEEKLNAGSQQEAITEAISIWNALSDHDKKLREKFWIAQYETDEDNCIDFDTENYYVNILDLVNRSL